MSSILDALKKLEAERVEVDSEEVEDSAWEEDPERDLVSPRRRRHRESRAANPYLIAAGVAIFAIFLVSAAVTAAVVVVRSTMKPPQVVAVASTPTDRPSRIQEEPREPARALESSPSTLDDSEFSLVPPEPEVEAEAIVAEETPTPAANGPEHDPVLITERPSAQEQNPDRVAALTPPDHTSVAPPKPAVRAPAPTPKTEKLPAPQPVEPPVDLVASQGAVTFDEFIEKEGGSLSLPVLTPPKRTPKPSSDSLSTGSEVNMGELASLTEIDQHNMGWPELKLQLLTPSKAGRGSALINLRKVQVGDIIPETNARLIAVDVKGIAVEVNGRHFRILKR